MLADNDYKIIMDVLFALRKFSVFSIINVKKKKRVRYSSK